MYNIIWKVNYEKIYKKIITVILLVVIAILFAVYFKNYINNNISIYKENNITTNINNTDKGNNQVELTEATVTKVIDGDTIWVNINGKEEKVRFIGVNCPEYTTKIEEYGKEATEYTTNELLGKKVYLQKDISQTDDYNRLLRYVWLEKIDTINEENIENYLFNAKLVINGYAQSNYYKPDISLQNYLEKFEKEAKKQKVGIWQ